ncbi:hypothetical protein CCMA1212_000436 [Trichoderma ghanense]|uniref:Uncharacterized protein n=1 Tax=Trichoderma ghanense TaxID=65468 RepID=A0ABY2HGR2_9HYPO
MRSVGYHRAAQESMLRGGSYRQGAVQSSIANTAVTDGNLEADKALGGMSVGAVGGRRSGKPTTSPAGQEKKGKRGPSWSLAEAVSG